MRKLFLFIAALTLCAGLWAQEINAVKFVQGQTTDWYLLADNPEVTFTDHNPVIAGKTYDLANGEVETMFGTAPADLWYTVREDGVANNWNTICLERNITAIDGATFWKVVSETDTEFELEQVSEPQAGYGYIIRYTATELKVQYGDETADAPVTATEQHPIQGIYEAITTYDQEGKNALTGNYVVYQNQLCKVTGWETMADHRAYVVADKAPKQAPAIAHGPRMTMPKPNNTPTSLDQTRDTRHQTQKLLRDGQLVIIRDNKMYNAQGIEVR